MRSEKEIKEKVKDFLVFIKKNPVKVKVLIKKEE